MIEVLDIQKNFKTGKEIRKSKLKDNSMTKGVATIELFDKDNNLIEQTISNNFITNPIDNVFLYRHLSSVLGNFNTYNDLSIERFSQIQLRYGNFDEDKNIPFVRGSLVGYCNRTQTSTGTNTLMGVYNSTESYAEYTKDGYYHCHMVYDFGTSQANGNINHVYWQNSRYNTNTASPLYVSRMPKYSTDKFTDDLYFDAKGDLITLKNGKYYKVKNENCVLNGIENAQYDEANPVDFISCENRINNNNYIKINSSYTASSILSNVKCNISINLYDSNTDEVVKTKNIDVINDFEQFKEVLEKSLYSKTVQYSKSICTDDGKVYIKIYCSIGGAYLPNVNSDGSYTDNQKKTNTYTICYNILTDEWIIRLEPYNYACNCLSSLIPDDAVASYSLDGNSKAFFGKANVSIVDLDTLTSTTYTGADISSERDSYHFFFEKGINFNKLISIGKYTQGAQGYRCYKIMPYSSHTKLPNTITKTSSNTIKITYDYYIQIPNLYAEEGQEFKWE